MWLTSAEYGSLGSCSRAQRSWSIASPFCTESPHRLCRSQWRITGKVPNGKDIEVHHHGMEVMRRMPSGEWVFFIIDHPWGADASWAVDRPPYAE